MTVLATPLESPRNLADHWTLDPDVTFLNHGSYGACPRVVQQVQAELRAQLEREPVRFMLRELQPLLDRARGTLADFLGAQAEDLAWVTNATTGVNTVLRSLRFQPGDELLTTDHAYNACRNALEYASGLQGAKVTVARVPFPLSGPEVVIDAVLAAVTPRTRLALLDHVTSPTGLVFPIERLVQELQARGIDVLVDGAHAPGMLPLDLDTLGAAYYTGNAHKWLCTPKGSAFLHVRRDRQPGMHPLVISHGYNATGLDRSRFQHEFGQTGTVDATAILCIPEALRFLTGLFGSMPALMAHNHALAVEGRARLAQTLGLALPCPAEMLGSLATLVLPLPPLTDPQALDPIQDRLWHDHGIEIPVISWISPAFRGVRIAMQAYNDLGQVDRLAEALRPHLA
jgi:isopenicillin-N epimerase